jgi:hypothetical protein
VNAKLLHAVRFDAFGTGLRCIALNWKRIG